jgi:CRP/FNR family transcriptional regulator
MQGYQFLAESSFFKELSTDSLRALSGICALKPLRKHDRLFREGEPGRAVYLLRRGAIQLHKSAPDGTEVVIKIVKPGEVFAEVVLFEQTVYPVTAVALASGEVIVFPRADMHRLLDAPSFRNDFLRMLMKKQRYLAERIVQISAHDVEDRLFWFLREQYGDTPTIQVAVSKKNVAAAIGTTPETLSRILLRLKKRRLLEWTGKTIRRLAPRPRADRNN